MKIKVEVITLQRVPNYGSVLQGYATQKVIEKLGYEVELINYYPQRMHMLAMLKRLKYKNDKLRKSLILRTIARLVIIPSYIKRFRVFNKFTKENIKMTDKEYITFEDLKKDIPEADIYCTGSDQVWNSKWNEGIDYSLFLDFLQEDKKRITYAASFGKAKLEENEKEETKRLISKYKYLAMREKSGVDIIKELGIKENVLQVLDPTLLLTGEEWQSLTSKKYQNKKYIFMYNINRDKRLDKYAKNFAKSKKLPLIYVSYNYHEAFKYGKLKCNPKVEDFLSLIANAEYVLTDSFHCLAYSINFNKQVIISYPERFSTRLASIAELTGVTNRVIDNYNNLSICDRKIDFEYANRMLENERKKSLEYLKKAIEE